MRFEILAENCDGYAVKAGTTIGTAFDYEKSTYEEQNKYGNDVDSFYDMDCNKLCRGEDGKLYAVMFDSKDSENPYIWQEVATAEQNMATAKKEAKARFGKADCKQITDIYGRVFTVDEARRKLISRNSKTGVAR